MMSDQHAASPSTPSEIEAKLRDDVLFAEKNGVEYLFAWDEDCNGIYGWKTPIDEQQPADTPTFGDDEHEAAINIHEWLSNDE